MPHRHVVFASSGGNFEGIYRHKFDGIPSRSRNPIVKQLMIGCFSEDLYAVIWDTKLENRSGSPHLWIRGKIKSKIFFRNSKKSRTFAKHNNSFAVINTKPKVKN